MKNKRFQWMQKTAKDRMRSGKMTGRRKLSMGVEVEHDLSGSGPVSYWTDFGFRLGSQWVSVWWIHPRMKLMDQIEEKAFALMEEYDSQNGENKKELFDFLDESAWCANYKNLGKSRKKIVSYSLNESEDRRERSRQRLQYMENQKRQIAQEKREVAPHMKVRQYAWGRGVDLCFPVELRSEGDVVAFALRLKEHMKGERDLFKEAPSVYSTEDLLDDVPDYATYNYLNE